MICLMQQLIRLTCWGVSVDGCVALRILVSAVELQLASHVILGSGKRWEKSVHDFLWYGILSYLELGKIWYKYCF